MNHFVNSEIPENADTPLKHRFKPMFKIEFKTIMEIIHLEPQNAKIHILITTVYNKTGEIHPTHKHHHPYLSQLKIIRHSIHSMFHPPHNTHLPKQHGYNLIRRYHQLFPPLHHKTRHLPHLHINQYCHPLPGRPQLRIIYHHRTQQISPSQPIRQQPSRALKKNWTHSNYRPYRLQNKTRRPPHPSHIHDEPMEVCLAADMNI